MAGAPRQRLPRLPSQPWRIGDRFELRYDYSLEGRTIPAGSLGKITLLHGPPNAVAFVVFDARPNAPPLPVGIAALARISRPPRPNPVRRKTAAARAAAPRQVRVARRELNAAVELFHKFREAPPRRVRLARFKVPKVCVVIGEMDFVGYTTTHAKKRARYRHDFSRKARPLLCASSDGRQLLIFGGNYDFTRDGIVDRA